MRSKLRATLISILLVQLGGESFAATLRVGPGGGFDFSTLTAAVGNSATADVLLVAPGIYDTTRGESFPLTPNSAITIRASEPEARPVIRGDRFNTIFFLDEIGYATLDGLVISDAGFGAIVIDSVTTTIMDSIVRDSRRSSGGGAILAEDSKLVLLRTELTGNMATRTGMAIQCTRCEVSILDSSVHHNPPDLFLAGDIFHLVNCPEFVLKNSIVDRNRGAGEGALIYMENLRQASGALVIEDCTITRNTPIAGSLIYMRKVLAELTRTSILENSDTILRAYRYVFFGDESSMNLSDTNISNNEGIGGIRIWDGTVTIEDSTVSENGAVGIDARALTMKNTLVNRNGLIGVRSTHFDIEDSEMIENGFAGMGPLTNPSSGQPESTISRTRINGNGLAMIDYSYDLVGIQSSAGVYVIHPAHFKNCEIIGNQWVGKTTNGVGGLILDADVLLEDSTIQGNTNDRWTAGVEIWRGEAVFSRCRIMGNRAEPEREREGQSIITLWSESKALFLNTLLAGNVWGSAPLIQAPAPTDLSQPNVRMVNCTVEGNQDLFSDSPTILDANEANVRIINSILWNGPKTIIGDNRTVSYSNFEDGILPGPGNISEDPLFFQPWDGTSADYR
ncbi:MAG: right-handed parallel beta-helix repeat-containing protein, partial [Candidatus Omnitrophica bacterium]|nr:right-handed parallel beta-helix repeat-containing protein [Candidatus Omnitrophota bacterium]